MIVQCDFDGTIITNNMCLSLREAFACDGWRDIEAAYMSHRLTIEESNRLQFLLVKQPKQVLETFIRRNIAIRPGFADFVRLCREHKVRLIIVSNGLDLYIKPVLEAAGLTDVEVFCARTEFRNDGILVNYLSPRGERINAGFKEKWLAWTRSQDSPVVYIGDGLSDLEAARTADYIFATGRLHRLMEERTVPHNAFSTFHDICWAVRLLAEKSGRTTHGTECITHDRASHT